MRNLFEKSLMTHWCLFFQPGLLDLILDDTDNCTDYGFTGYCAESEEIGFSIKRLRREYIRGAIRLRCDNCRTPIWPSYFVVWFKKVSPIIFIVVDLFSSELRSLEISGHRTNLTEDTVLELQFPFLRILYLTLGLYKEVSDQFST